MATQVRDANNFDALRIALALMVFFAHLATLTGHPALQGFMPYLDADFAVKGFFAISGFLVMGSYVASTSFADYAEKRVRRIYPAYLCAILLCVAVGAATTSLPLADFLGATQTAKYLAANAAFLNFLQPTLSGVFAGNPMPAMDGSLWTIKVELALYCCVPALLWLFRRYGSVRVAVALALGSAAWVYLFRYHVSAGWANEASRQFPGQLSYFVLGALLRVSKTAFEHLAKVLLVSALLFAVTHTTPLQLWIEPFFYASLVILLATGLRRHVPLGRYGDISYGVYLFHFPIIQTLIHLHVYDAHPYAGAVLALALTLGAAWLSWHLVEKRMLRRSASPMAATVTQ